MNSFKGPSVQESQKLRPVPSGRCQGSSVSLLSCHVGPSLKCSRARPACVGFTSWLPYVRLGPLDFSALVAKCQLGSWPHTRFTTAAVAHCRAVMVDLGRLSHPLDWQVARWTGSPSLCSARKTIRHGFLGIIEFLGSHLFFLEDIFYMALGSNPRLPFNN